MASGTSLSLFQPESNGSSPELAALSKGQTKIADDIAHVISIVRNMQREINRLVAATCPDGASVQTPVHRDTKLHSCQLLPAQHMDASLAKQEEQPSPTCAIPVCTSNMNEDMALAPCDSDVSFAVDGSKSSGTVHGQSVNSKNGVQFAHDDGSEIPDWPASIAFRESLESLANQNWGHHLMEEHTASLGVINSVASRASRPVGRVGSLMMDPNSGRRNLFDLASMAVLFYDIIVIPYVLAWDVDFEGWLKIASWSTCMFWTADIMFTFMTGIHENGNLQLDPRRVALKYLRTWLIPDVVVAAADLFSVVLMTFAEEDSGNGGALKIIKFAKLGRLLRIMAVLRTVKFVVLLQEHVESRLSESLKAALKVYMLACSMLFVNHWITCAWMAVGRVMPSDTGRRWIDTDWAMDGRQVEFIQADGWTQYVTALHWSVAQFTLGSIEITCNNSSERIFNIICLFIGFLFGSTLVSLLSATMVDFQMMMKERTVQTRKLKRYLKDNMVDRKMVVRVEQQITERLNMKAALTEQDVPVLQLLSTQLRVELRCVIFEQHLLTHPLFRVWNGLDSSMLQRLCKLAVDFSFLRATDDLFATGAMADAAYYVVSGTLKYHHGAHSEEVHPGTWLCEAALWTQWIHVGRLEASTSASLVSISADGLVEAVRHTDMVDITLDYGRVYHRKVVSAEEPTDVQVPSTSWENVVLGMSPSQQEQIALLAFERLREQQDAGFTHLWRRASSRGLRDEIRDGRSCIFVNHSREVERVVPVVVLRIERHRGDGTQVLVELGRSRDGHMEPSFKLPGLKQGRGETPEQAVGRLLRDRLSIFAGKVEMQSSRREDQQLHSRRFEVKTNYLRTVCTASATDDVDGLSFSCPAPVLTDAGLAGVNLGRMRGSVRSRGSDDEERLPSFLSRVRVRTSFAPRMTAVVSEVEWEILVIRDNQDTTAQLCFAWLTDDEFDSVCLRAGTDELSKWLAVLQQRFQLRQQLQQEREEQLVEDLECF